MQNGPLEGVRLTEFTSAWAGPYATCLLGFLGAEVIKVESRARLDHSRNLSFSTGKQFTGPDQSEVFNNLNLNKKSITLNLKEPGAIELAKKVAGVSDVVMENMRPGVMPRLGLGYEALREHLARRYGVSPEEVLCSLGASMANFLLCGILLEPGDEVVVEKPAYKPLVNVPQLFGATIRRLE